MRRATPRRRRFLSSVTAQSESGNRDFTPGGAPVTSPKGAMYAMQVMPGTAGDPGYGVKPAQSATPGEFNRVGRDYLGALHRKYGGDVAKMWAAYNWGPGKLDRAIATHGANWLSKIPEEVRSYVTKNVSALRGR